MSWVKIDDAVADHPKILSVGPVAAWLWVCGLAYCNKRPAAQRDGIIPESKAPILFPIKSPEREIARLIEAGLWERTDKGYLVHDYADYQPVVSQELRAARQAAGRVGGKQKASKYHANGKQPASNLPEKTKQQDPVPVPVPDPDPESRDVCKG